MQDKMDQSLGLLKVYVGLLFHAERNFIHIHMYSPHTDGVWAMKGTELKTTGNVGVFIGGGRRNEFSRVNIKEWFSLMTLNS